MRKEQYKKLLGSDANWYNYAQKKWANAQTEDGSMWVWIPRYAYKINKSTQTTDVVFLIGTTDKYYDENGEMKTAQRATAANPVPNTETEYTVHPAFTNESSINYANGGWDKELAGIWVAKFEAGYASGNNTAKVESSGVNYSQASAYVPAVEAGTSSDTTKAARNWLDGEYGVYNSETGKYEWKDGVQTAIKYPTFQGITYVMNYINHNDAYNISKALTGTNNIYGLKASEADSHLMKNSEWGAVAYLSKSKYGLNGTNIYINNVTLGNSTPSVYAVTGCCTSTNNSDQETTTTTIAEINARTASGVYVWSQKDGQRASSTGTIYGVYDMSGGLWERTAAYVANGHANLKEYGASVAYDGNTLKTTSTKYTTVYPRETENTSSDIDVQSRVNYVANTSIFGDAVRETSTNGTGSTSWYGDYSYLPALGYPFFIRGGRWDNGSFAGVTAFDRSNGKGSYHSGFRPVLVAL